MSGITPPQQQNTVGVWLPRPAWDQLIAFIAQNGTIAQWGGLYAELLRQVQQPGWALRRDEEGGNHGQTYRGPGASTMASDSTSTGRSAASS